MAYTMVELMAEWTVGMSVVLKVYQRVAVRVGQSESHLVYLSVATSVGSMAE